MFLKNKSKVKYGLIFKQLAGNLNNSNSQWVGCGRGPGQLLRKGLNKRMKKVTMACKLWLPNNSNICITLFIELGIKMLNYNCLLLLLIIKHN